MVGGRQHPTGDRRRVGTELLLIDSRGRQLASKTVLTRILPERTTTMKLLRKGQRGALWSSPVLQFL